MSRYEKSRPLSVLALLALSRGQDLRTEWRPDGDLFHDNADDLAVLESAPGRQAIIDLHVRGIISFVNAYSK